MAGSREWYEKNRERSREIARNSYYKNREEILAKRRAKGDGASNSAKWRKANPEKAADIYFRARLKRRGLTEKDFMDIAEQQNFVCAICSRDEELVIDHNHETGKVRGLLCRTCNRGIGLLQDNQDILLKAYRYLGE